MGMLLFEHKFDESSTFLRKLSKSRLKSLILKEKYDIIIMYIYGQAVCAFGVRAALLSEMPVNSARILHHRFETQNEKYN